MAVAATDGSATWRSKILELEVCPDARGEAGIGDPGHADPAIEHKRVGPEDGRSAMHRGPTLVMIRQYFVTVAVVLDRRSNRPALSVFVCRGAH